MATTLGTWSILAEHTWACPAWTAFESLFVAMEKRAQTGRVREARLAFNEIGHRGAS